MGIGRGTKGVKLNQTSKEVVKEFLKRIEPYKKGVKLVELFGSCARGQQKANSDIDLLVVLKNNRLRQKMYEAVEAAMGAIGYKELLSPIIMDVDHYQKIKAHNSDLYYFISKEGKTLWPGKK